MKIEHKSASMSKAIKIISLTISHENILGERGKNLVLLYSRVYTILYEFAEHIYVGASTLMYILFSWK